MGIFILEIFLLLSVMMFAFVLTTQRQDKDTLFQEIFIIKAIYNVSPFSSWCVDKGEWVK